MRQALQQKYQSGGTRRAVANKSSIGMAGRVRNWMCSGSGRFWPVASKQPARISGASAIVEHGIAAAPVSRSTGRAARKRVHH